MTNEEPKYIGKYLDQDTFPIKSWHVQFFCSLEDVLKFNGV